MISVFALHPSRYILTERYQTINLNQQNVFYFKMLIKKNSEMSTKCPACSKTVYAAEEKMAGGHKWHKACFKCCLCNKRLDSTLVNEAEGKLFCKVSGVIVMSRSETGVHCRLATVASWVPRAMGLVRELGH